jgi:hypothetical protein
VDRRRFDNLFEELSVALGRLAPRYALWLHMGEQGLDPNALSQDEALGFLRDHLPDFLHEHDLWLSDAGARKLEKTVGRFDPQHLTPYEHMARLGEPTRRS